ncbi:MAG: nickel-responsive transcriptional regulator NikR [Lentisphaeria bacterium]
MSDLVRMSMSIEEELYEQLEKLVAVSGYGNRSEYIRDLIRNAIVEAEWETNSEVLGTITLIYDHHQRRLSERLTELQHQHHEAVLASTHVHLDRHMCAEVIIVRGAAGDIRRLADELRQQKGVLHAELSGGSTGHMLA